MRPRALALGGLALVVALTLALPVNSSTEQGQGLTGAAAGATLSTKGRIVALALDRSTLAAATGGVPKHCDRIVVWTAAGKRTVGIDTELNCEWNDATVSRVIEIAVGAGRVAWIEALGGNRQTLTLYSASAAGGRVAVSEFVENGFAGSEDVGGDWIGELHGAGSVLAYNSWTVCSRWAHPDQWTLAECPVDGQVSRQSLWRIAATGVSARMARGAGSFRLRAVGGGWLALEATPKFTLEAGPIGTGPITILSATGLPPMTIRAQDGGQRPRGIALTRTQLVIEHRTTLDVYDLPSGDLRQTIQLGAAAHLQLVGANAELAMLTGRHRLVAVRLTDGRQARIALPREAMTGASPISPRLSESGLAYGYNLPTGAARGRLVFAPRSELLKHFSAPR